MSGPRVRVLVVEDHPVTRLGLRAALGTEDDIEVVGEADSLAEARGAIRASEPDVVLLDLHLPDGNALGDLRELRRCARGAEFIVVTGIANERHEHMAHREGAFAFLPKGVTPAELAECVRAAARGERPAARPTPPTRGAALLTPRELEILALIVEGLTNAEIGGVLGLSTGTVRTHVSHILEKLDVGDRTEAAAVALRGGLVV